MPHRRQILTSIAFCFQIFTGAMIFKFPPTIVVLVTMAAVLLVGVLGIPVQMEARRVKDRDAQA